MVKKGTKATRKVDVVLLKVRVEQIGTVWLAVSVYGDMGNMPTIFGLSEAIGNVTSMPPVIDFKAIFIHVMNPVE